MKRVGEMEKIIRPQPYEEANITVRSLGGRENTFYVFNVWRIKHTVCITHMKKSNKFIPDSTSGYSTKDFFLLFNEYLLIKYGRVIEPNGVH